MIVNRAYRFRLYPNREQEQALSRQFGSSRFVYNNFLRARVDYYLTHKDSDGKKGLNYHDTARMLTELKRQAEYKWLSEANPRPFSCGAGLTLAVINQSCIVRRVYV